MLSFPKFEEIRPYSENKDQNEVKNALSRIVSNKAFYVIMDYLYPDLNKDIIISKILSMSSSTEFQQLFMHPSIRRIIEKSSKGLTFDGFNKIAKDGSYLYISNHRDIFLDSGILQILLLENNFVTTQITFGNNLMSSNFITDLGKVNKMFTVYRGSTNKELYEKSKLLSEYIRFTITKNNESVWIAQSNGRTKDGDDKTQTGLLKMLNVSGKSSIFENFEQLNIMPISISYEYEPCDFKKTQELYLSINSTYIKGQDEDLQSIVTGIVENKGCIHLSIGDGLKDKLQEINNITNENEKIKALALLIDIQIIKNYKLWSTNYMAFDLLNKTKLYTNFYSDDELNQFKSYLNFRLKDIKGEKRILNQIILNIYANPLKNKLKLGLI